MESKLIRAAIGIPVVCLVLVACGATSRVNLGTGPDASLIPAPPPTTPPADKDVVAGRFVTGAELDNAVFYITPAPASLKPEISQAQASILYEADSAVAGAHSDSLLGFGLVTVRQSMTAAAGDSSLQSTPAWIGVASGAIYSCPFMPVSQTTIPAAEEPPTPGYTAVVIVGRGTQVVTYDSRGGPCGERPTGPDLASSLETISSNWQEVGMSGSTLSLRYQRPSCIAQQPPEPAWNGNLNTGDGTVTVDVTVPYGSTSCPAVWTDSTFQIGPPTPTPGGPPVPSTFHLAHGPTGPVDVLELPGR
jgi:hypothetical protein